MIVWLASYPRSGNTFFRVVLNSVFNIKTYSIYNDTGDIGADEKTSDVVGHEFLPEGFDIQKARESDEIFYIKTHDLLSKMKLLPSDKVIYLIRDGRESTLSFTKHLKTFYKKKDDDLSDVIYGNTSFGSWGEHVREWDSVDKLIIKFEEMTDNPTSKLKEIGDYLNLQPVNEKIPSFEELQKINPKFFRSGKKNSWEDVYSEEEHMAFWLKNYKEMDAYGYNYKKPEALKDIGTHIFSQVIINQNNYLINLTLEKDKKTQVINNRLSRIERQLDERNKELKQKQNTIDEKNKELKQKQNTIDERNKELKYKQNAIDKKNKELTNLLNSRKYMLGKFLVSPYTKLREALK